MSVAVPGLDKVLSLERWRLPPSLRKQQRQETEGLSLATKGELSQRMSGLSLEKIEVHYLPDEPVNLEDYYFLPSW